MLRVWRVPVGWRHHGRQQRLLCLWGRFCLFRRRVSESFKDSLKVTKVALGNGIIFVVVVDVVVHLPGVAETIRTCLHLIKNISEAGCLDQNLSATFSDSHLALGGESIQDTLLNVQVLFIVRDVKDEVVGENCAILVKSETNIESFGLLDVICK